MRSGTLSRTRIFRADPDLDAAVAAGAARQGVPVSEFLRATLRSALAASRAAATSSNASTASGACR